MKKSLLVLTLCAFFFAGCKKDTPVISSENSILSFKIEQVNNIKQVTGDINCTVSDSLIAGETGNTNSKATLVASFVTSGSAAVTVNGIEQVSGVTINDFSGPVIYTVTAKNGSQKKYTINLKVFTGLPILYINTDAPVVSKDDYVNGTLMIDGNLSFTDGLYNGNIQIKGRGNSTWNADKRPYKIKLPSKSTILGMPADKEWALLANYFDKTLMRNDVAFELSERMGLAWTPRRRFVEVFMNGEYEGNYTLTETVKIATNRLNITSMDAKKPADTTGGYLVVADLSLDGDQWFKTTSQVAILMDDPDPVTSAQFNFIHNQFQSMEDNIGNYVDVRSQIDLDSWIRWVIVNEVMRNRDATLGGSCYFYGNGGKIFMGPVWDFDLSSGGYQGNDPEGWYVNTANWIGGLFLYHPYYKERFKQIWNEKFNSIASITNYVKANNGILQNSQKTNFLRWNIMDISTYDGQIVSGGYQNEVDHLSGFLEQRINWINSQVNSW